ncbi:MAG: ABC transporter ATP-binding protein [Methanomicrobiaceae archaeon]|nr:ABC transporter ATP-binding protein [Methanomicrobiaceae archaeon]
MIEFERVSLRLGTFALREVSFTIRQGDFYFIIGPSGAGKTVLLEAIAGLHAPQSGHVLLRGEDVAGIPPERRRIALVYQDYSLFPHMNVAKNIAFGLKMQKADRRTVEKRVEELLQAFDIEGLRDRSPLTLSGGEQQRVAIARALAVSPDILLLDEPFSALDPLTKDKFIEDLREVHRTHDLTIVQVTHARDEAKRLASRVAVIIEGVLAAEGGVEQIFNAPDTCEVARFVGIENILPGTIISGSDHVVKVDTGAATITAVSDLHTGEGVAVCFRAEDVTLSPPGSPRSSARNTFEGTITGFTPMGPLVRVSIDCGFPLVATVLRDTVNEMGLAPGSLVSASVKASIIHLTSRSPVHRDMYTKFS